MIRHLCAAVAIGFAGTQALWAEAGPRILSLGGTVTEIVAALGSEAQLVGRDSTSTFPETVTALPDVGYLRALSPEGVLSMSPDLIIAEADAGPPETIALLQGAGVPFLSVPAGYAKADILARVDAVAKALGKPEEGAALAGQVATSLDQAEQRAKAVDGPKKRVLFVLSLQGGRIMAAGQDTAADAMLALAGAENAMQGFTGYKPVTDEAVLAAAPDAVLMMDRAGDHAMPAAEVLALPALASSPAAAEGRLIQMDGLLLLGFGPRTAEAANALHDALYRD